MSAPVGSRRLLAAPQLVAWLLVFGLGVEGSGCPPGMDSGMDMPKPMSVGQHASEADHEHAGGGMDCPFGGSMDDEGRMSCPLAIGGVGVCVGAAASSPSASVAVAPLEWVGEASLVELASHRPNPPTEIRVPPPRA